LLTSLGGRSFAWDSATSFGFIALIVVSLIAFFMIEARAAEPILPLWLFKMNVFWVTSAFGFAVGAALFGAITFVPLYLQIAMATTPTQSGLLLIPLTAGILAASTTSGIYMGRTGKYKRIPIIGMTLLTLGLTMMAFLQVDTNLIAFCAMLTCVGLGMGCIFPVITTAVQNAVPREAMGTATAASIMVRQTGGALGVAAFGALFANRLTAGLDDAAALLDGGAQLGPQTLAKLTPEMQAQVAEAVINAIHPIFWICAGLGLIGLAFAFLLEEVPLAGFDLTHHAAEPWQDWLPTRYEIKALREGRAPWYMTFRRHS
jgi:MFS family permease